MAGSSCGALPCSCGINSYSRRARAIMLALIMCGDAPTRPPRIIVNRVCRPPFGSSSPPSAVSLVLEINRQFSSIDHSLCFEIFIITFTETALSIVYNKEVAAVRNLFSPC